MIFGAWSPPAPSSQMSPPGGRPWGHPLLISVFPPLFSVYAVGFTTWCIVKLNLLLNVTLLLEEVTMPDFGHFEPFLPTFVPIWLIPWALWGRFPSYPTPYRHQISNINSRDTWGNLEHLLKTILERFVISLPSKMYPPTDNFGKVMTDGRWTLHTWCLLTVSVKKHPRCRS